MEFNAAVFTKLKCSLPGKTMDMSFSPRELLHQGLSAFVTSFMMLPQFMARWTDLFLLCRLAVPVVWRVIILVVE